MKISAATRGKCITSPQFRSASRASQRGMGATIVLFTIALIVLVGAALAYASRGNPVALNTQGAKVFAGVMLKQSADYRDGYSRYIFDGGISSAMTFKATGLPTGDLFNPASQYSVYQPPPAQATILPADNAWLYNNNVTLDSVGTATGIETITLVSGLTKTVCEQANNQMFGTIVIPTSTLATATAAKTSGAAFGVTTPGTPGRSSGCIQLGDSSYLFYSTLGES